MTVTTMHRLRAETRAAHERLEGSIDLSALTATPDHYRALISRFYGFHAAIEPSLSAALSGHYAPVARTPLLERDLRALGVSESCLREIPRCDDLPEHGSAARAFGVAYVLEGSALGGQIVGRLVRDRLGYDAETGVAFFLSHGRHVGLDWRAFGQACDAFFAERGDGSEAVAAADETFAAMGRWLAAGGLV
ncbi:MAG: biliverdin-producing heme oxygenase [Fimbriimonas sp.]